MYFPKSNRKIKNFFQHKKFLPYENFLLYYIDKKLLFLKKII